jgi:sulfur-carrier protein adenylyltransferase/sulfurtransferase
MEMEKGAVRFYDLVCRRHAGAAFADTFKNLSKAEKDHARAIYAHWVVDQENSLPFEQLFDRLDGDILEGGETLSKAFDRLALQREKTCLNLVELAIEMENTAFDLYRTLADRSQNDSIKNIAADIAQAEKNHMQTLFTALEQCG